MSLPRRPYGPHDPDPADPLLDGLKAFRFATRDLIVARRTVLRCQEHGSQVVLAKAWRKFYAAEDCFSAELRKARTMPGVMSGVWGVTRDA